MGNVVSHAEFVEGKYQDVIRKVFGPEVLAEMIAGCEEILSSRNVKLMWPGERAGVLLKMWRRYTRFQRSVRAGRESDAPPQMAWSDLPQLDPTQTSAACWAAVRPNDGATKRSLLRSFPVIFSV